MNIRTGALLPFNVIALGVGLFVCAPVIFNSYPILAVILVLIGLTLFTMHNRLEVDFKRKYYREYVWVLGFKSGEQNEFRSVQYFYITQSRVAQEYGFNPRMTSRGYRYNGYLKFDEKINVSVGDSMSKDILMKKIKKMSAQSGLGILDNS